MKRKRVRNGDIWFINCPDGIGCEQQGDRVFLVVSNDICHENSELVIGILGTKLENKEQLQDTHFIITTDYGLKYDSVFMAEQIIRIDRQRLLSYCAHVDKYKMEVVNRAVSVALNMFEPINHKYIRLLLDYINLLDKDLMLYNSPQMQASRNERIEELKSYCEEYNYDYNALLDRYLIFREVEGIG